MVEKETIINKGSTVFITTESNGKASQNSLATNKITTATRIHSMIYDPEEGETREQQPIFLKSHPSIIRSSKYNGKHACGWMGPVQAAALHTRRQSEVMTSQLDHRTS